MDLYVCGLWKLVVYHNCGHAPDLKAVSQCSSDLVNPGTISSPNMACTAEQQACRHSKHHADFSRKPQKTLLVGSMS